jgi:hypothetical protein
VKFLIERFGKDRFLEAYRSLEPARNPEAVSKNLERVEKIFGHSLTELEQQWIASFSKP